MVGRIWIPLCGDLLLLGCGVLVVALLARFPGMWAALPVSDVVLLLVSMAAACAAMAAILAAVVHRLSDDRRAAWISAAFTVYAVVGVPSTTLSGRAANGEPPLEAVRFAAHTALGVLLVVAIWPPVRRRAVNALSLSIGALLWVVFAGVLSSAAPAVAIQVSTNAVVRGVLASTLVLVGVALAVAGVLEGSRQLARVGIGAAAVAAAHLYRVLDQQAAVTVTFSAIRLLAVALALGGLVQLSRGALGAMHKSSAERQEELRLAQMGLARAAERDHELRNGLAGLAGATYLLGEPQIEGSGGLRTAVQAELARLESMLAGDRDGALNDDPDQSYQVDTVTRDLVALRRCGGMDIRCDVDAWLWAQGSPTVLKQVLANVLANCARHAPGSPVRVQVCRRGERIRVRISDFGPGLAPGSEEAVFDRGTRSRVTGGQGLGLHICRELLSAEGAMIEIRSTPSIRAGCTVIVEVPRAETPGGRTELGSAANVG